MNTTSNPCTVLVIAFLALGFVLVSCSTGPAPPAQGSPAWHWENAHTTWQAGDLQKTADNLESLIEPGNEYAERAQPWRLILTVGMASGYMGIANAFENGSRANAAASADFRRNMNNYRTMANSQVGEFYETFMAYKKSAAEDVPLAFSYPQGSAMMVAEFNRAGEGMMISQAELASAEKRALQRAVLLTTCLAVGAEEDTARTQQMFVAENPSVPRDTFNLALARKLNEIANFYSSYKMDQPDRLKLFNEQALELLKPMAEAEDEEKSEEAEKLIEKIEQEIKAAEKR